MYLLRRVYTPLKRFSFGADNSIVPKRGKNRIAASRCGNLFPNHASVPKQNRAAPSPQKRPPPFAQWVVLCLR